MRNPQKSWFSFLRTSFLIIAMVALFLHGCSSAPTRRSDEEAPKSQRQQPAQQTQSQNEAASLTEGATTDAEDPYAAIPGLSKLLKEDPLENPTPVKGDWIIQVISGEPRSLNPVLTSSTYEFMVTTLMFDGGIDYDFNQTAVPAIYKSWTPSEDYREITIQLDETRHWSDGTPVTAHDFHFAYEKILDPTVPALTYRDSLEKFEKFEVIDDYTMKITFKEPQAGWEADISFPYIPKHILKDVEDFNKADFNRNPIVTGPYMIDKWETQQQLVLKRNPNYDGDHPGYAEKIIFKIIDSATVQMNAFLKGEVDAIDLTAEQLVRYAADEQFSEFAKVKVRGVPGYSYIGWNMDGSNPFFTDVRVRKALAHAMDIQSVIRDLLYNLNEQSTGIFHPEQWFSNKDIEPIKFNLREADRLLKEAGWKDTDGDGIIDKDGVAFKFECLLPSGSSAGEQILTIYKKSLSKLGIEMTIRQIEWATMSEMTNNHQFQAFMAGWGGGFFPHSSYNIWHSSMYEKGRNYVGYNNPEVDRLLEQGRLEFSRERQKEIYSEVQRIVYEDQPYCFLYARSYRMAHHRRIRGIRLSLYGPYRFSPGMLDWWVPKEQQLYGD